MRVDPSVIEIIQGGLIYTAEEMGIALRKSAYSPNIKERMDHSCAIFDPLRRMVAQAEHIPVHLGSMNLAVKMGLDYHKKDLEEGDMLFFNDPYISGTHLPDFTLIAPAYYEGKLIAFLANKAHHSDVGGKAPGSLAGDVTELFQEGIIIPPIKLLKKSKLDEDLSRFILSNVRTPIVTMGDLRAQIAANNLGIRRIQGIVKKHGIEKFFEAIKAIMDYSERRMRSEVLKMLKGTYEQEDFLESTGVSNKAVKIKVKILIEGDEITFDYSGTDPQVEGSVNAPLGVTLSGVYYALISVTDPTIPLNDGCYRPVKTIVPKGCLLNPIKPAPVAGGNVETSQRNVDVLFKTFAQILPNRVCAAGQGTMNNVCVGGINPRTKSPWTFYETIAGGYGGRPGIDGVDGVHVHMTNTLNTPMEAIEAVYPIRFLKYQLRCDTGGPGKWRGGCGVERSWLLLAPSATLSILAERNIIRPWGLFGGKPGALGMYIIKKPNGSIIKLRSKCTLKMIYKDILIVKTPGGGGYGNPFERDPMHVLEDVMDDLVSRRAAYHEYGCKITQDLKIDWNATQKLRIALSS